MTAASPPVTSERQPDRPPGAGFSWAALLFLGPAGLLLGAFLVFPTIYTFLLSFNRGRGGEFTNWVGGDNWIRLFTQDPNFLRLGFPPSGALWNNVLWIVFYVSLTVLFGLVIAVMATRVRYEAWVKGIVFLPQAIAATSLAIIWRFVYSPDPETGLMNAVLGVANVGPVSLLGNPDTVNWALIAVGIWSSVGFATVILSAAIKGISSEVLEAARVDGATEPQIFWRIILPLSLPAVAVTALFSFMTAWNEFILAAKFMSAETSYTLPVVLQGYVGQKSTAWGHFAAGAILVSDERSSGGRKRTRVSALPDPVRAHGRPDAARSRARQERREKVEVIGLGPHDMGGWAWFLMALMTVFWLVVVVSLTVAAARDLLADMLASRSLDVAARRQGKQPPAVG